jgi:hypothetical protein
MVGPAYISLYTEPSSVRDHLETMIELDTSDATAILITAENVPKIVE